MSMVKANTALNTLKSEDFCKTGASGSNSYQDLINQLFDLVCNDKD